MKTKKGKREKLEWQRSPGIMAWFCGGPRSKRVMIGTSSRVRFLVGHVSVEVTGQWKLESCLCFKTNSVFRSSQVVDRLGFCSNCPS